MSWLHQVTKILELQLQHQSFQWVFRVISFKIDWFDLFAAQGTLKSLLQHHSLKASILWHSAFFMVQFSQPYMMAGKTIALSIRTFVGRVMSLLFNSLSVFVIASLPRSNHLLNSWLQSPSTVLLEPKKRKSCHCFHPFPSICHYLMGLDAIFLVFWIFNFKRSSFTLIKRIFSSSLLSATRVVSFAYLRLLIFLLPTLTLGVGDGQGSLACCSPWSRKESDTTEWLNWTELNWTDLDSSL